MDPHARLMAVPKFGRGPCLDRMTQLLRVLGCDSLAPGIKVTGSNGKGSTTAVAAAILGAHGLRTGRYTSPHLLDFRERIAVDGVPIPLPAFDAVLERVLHSAESVAPGAFGSFEFTTAIAARWFLEQEVEALVWEAGIGGRLDATRPLRAPVTVITSVGLEHTALLGGTHEAIVREKAELADTHSRLLLPPLAPALVTAATLQLAPRHVAVEIVPPLGSDAPLGLLGAHQRQNAALAHCSAQVLLGAAFDARLASQALATARWPGRLDLRRHASGARVVIDGAHNLDGVLAVAEALRSEPSLAPRPPGRRVLVFGASLDRPAREMLAVLRPLAEALVVTAARHKGTPPEDFAPDATRAPSVAAALEVAAALAGPAGIVVVTGGLFLAAEAVAGFEGVDPLTLRFW